MGFHTVRDLLDVKISFVELQRRLGELFDNKKAAEATEKLQGALR